MTTLRDLIRDFGMEILKKSDGAMPEEEFEKALDEYIKTIKERIIG